VLEGYLVQGGAFPDVYQDRLAVCLVSHLHCRSRRPRKA
jgi:hypothetical protein